MRKTNDPLTLSFVADADALSTPDELDVNNNNVVDDYEEPSFTGDPYVIEPDSVLRDEAFLKPSVDAQATTDQWGRLISAYAPIYNAKGESVAILGMDIKADDFDALTQSTFSIVAVLLVGLVGVFLAAYVLFIIRSRNIDALIHMDEERTALLDLASHQLGMPLATFKWWLELLKEHSDKKLSTERDVYDQLQQGIDRMDSIIAALHEASSLQTDEYHGSSTSSVAVIAKKVVSDLSKTYKKRKQHIRLEIAPGLKRIALDGKLLAGMLRELLENASFYSMEKSEVIVRARHIMSGVEISVIDHGHGIPKEDLPHIFEKFRRGSNAMKYKPAGNGLGLFIVRRIVEKAHGRIRIQSTLNKGTTITIQLPIA
jgi:K+-sensing histidine kinase KdpD